MAATALSKSTITPLRDPRDSAVPWPRYRNPLSVTSTMSAHVFALPTSIAVRKLPCWFAILNQYPESVSVRYGNEFSSLGNSNFHCAGSPAWLRAIAGLGFGPPAPGYLFGATDALSLEPAPAFFTPEGVIAEVALAVAVVFLRFGRTAVFLLLVPAAGGFASSFFWVNSNAGFGNGRSRGPIRV